MLKKHSLARDEAQKKAGSWWEGPGVCHAKESGSHPVRETTI